MICSFIAKYESLTSRRVQAKISNQPALAINKTTILNKLPEKKLWPTEIPGKELRYKTTQTHSQYKNSGRKQAAEDGQET